MPAPHPPALRQRVVDAYENGEGTYAEIADRFKVGVASVSRWLGLARYAGDVTPKATGGDRREPVSEKVRAYILLLVRDEPAWTTTELSEQVLEDLGVAINRKRVGRVLHDAGFSFKRGSSDRQQLGGPRTSSSAKRSSSSSPAWILPA